MPDITVGTNSYVSVGTADEYMASRLYADAWGSADATDKTKALMMATRAIDRLLLAGRPADLEQDLAFPRDGQDDVPQAVADATCEEALAILDSDLEFRRNLRNYGITSTAIGNVREGFANRSMRHGGMIEPKGLRSLEAREFMRPYVAGSVVIR